MVVLSFPNNKIFPHFSRKEPTFSCDQLRVFYRRETFSMALRFESSFQLNTFVITACLSIHLSPIFVMSS